MTEIEYLYNYPESSKISERMLDFFCSEVLYSLSRPKDQHLWIVSPWIREIQFPIVSRGDISHLFPDNNGSFITLSEILLRLIEQGVKITIVCLPPHKLVSLQKYLYYIDIEMQISKMRQSFENLHQDLAEISQNAPTDKFRTNVLSIEDVLNDLQTSAIQKYSMQQDSIKFGVMRHKDMLEFLRKMQISSNDKLFEVVYNEKLHAKMVIGSFGGFFGSANITPSGLNSNDEFYVYVQGEEEILKLRKSANSFTEWIKGKTGLHPSNKYPAKYAFGLKIDEDRLNNLLKYPFPEEMLQVLELSNLPVSPEARHSLHTDLDEADTMISPNPNRYEVETSPICTDSPIRIDPKIISRETWLEIREYCDQQYKSFVSFWVQGNELTSVLENYLRLAYVSALRNGWKEV